MLALYGLALMLTFVAGIVLAYTSGDWRWLTPSLVAGIILYASW